MRTILVTLGILAVTFTLKADDKRANAGTPDQISQVFENDRMVLEQEFQSLHELEKEIKSQNLTFSDLDEDRVNELSLKNDVHASLLAVAGADDLPLGIPGFWWGFCLGLVGILLVYILMEDSPDRKEQTKKALIGALIWVGIWIILWITVLGTAAVL